jgi:rhodanese-related sulfurtransferase
MIRPSTLLPAENAFATRPSKQEYSPIYQPRLRFSSTTAITDITKEDMEFIIGRYEGNGRENSGYIVLDVRGDGEVERTGKLSPNTQTLPLPEIMDGCLLAPANDFRNKYGFDKPTMDETLVFFCASGMRARKAAEHAMGDGYPQVVVYGGGANEWFSVFPQPKGIMLFSLGFVGALAVLLSS